MNEGLTYEKVGTISVDTAIDIAKALGIDHTMCRSLTITAEYPECVVFASLLTDEQQDGRGTE